MSELAIDKDLGLEPGRPSTLAQLQVVDISSWVEHYTLMAAVLAALSGQGPRIPCLPCHHRWCMTGGTGGRCWPAKTLTGQSLTPGFITKPSRGGFDPSSGAPCASRRAIPPTAVLEVVALAILAGAGHLTQLNGQATPRPTCRRRQTRSAAGTMRGRAKCRGDAGIACV